MTIAPPAHATAGPALVAIVGVTRAESIRCQAPGCNHTVWRRIHVIRLAAGEFRLYGSTCFAKLLGATTAHAGTTPQCGAKEHVLSAADRAALLERTADLVERLAAAYRATTASSLLPAQQPLGRASRATAGRPRIPDVPPDVLARLRPVAIQALLAEKPGFERADFDLPGWQGVVLTKVRELWVAEGP